MRDSTKKRELIRQLPCFSSLSEHEIIGLATLLEEKMFQKGSKIVEEHASVDSIYIIETGEAEVTRRLEIKIKKLLPRIKINTQIVPLAILQTGEAIGLNDTGFFSNTGKRTATVTAITDVKTFYLSLDQLHHFLKIHPHISQQMFASAEQMLRVLLIKQSLPFSNLSHARLMQLAKQVVVEEYPVGTVIFKEGDPGDRSYLIHSGSVQISVDDEDQKRELAVLTTPALFGEATLITRTPRNATAYTLEDTRLLMIKHDLLSELIESEKNVATMFMQLMVDRSRPIQKSIIEQHEQVTHDAQHIVILKNPENGHYFKLSREGWYVWNQLDGKQTMQEIVISLANEYDIFAPDIVAGLISKLTTTGFVTNVELNITTKLSPWRMILNKFMRVFSFRYAFGDADKWLTKLYNYFGFIFFTTLGKLIVTVMMLSGFLAFAFSTPSLIDVFHSIHASWLLTVIIPFMMISVIFHELGHALATKSYGREVHYVGVGLLGMTPIAFVDTSDMWLQPNKMPRVFVNLAGIFSDILVAACAAFLIFSVDNPYIKAMLWLYALFTYINSFKMLNPIYDYDGYYVLLDLFDKPKLRKLAVKWIVNEFPKIVKKENVFRGHWAEAIYWLWCILYIISVSALTLFIQTIVFKVLGFQPAHIYLVLFMPMVAALAAISAIIVEIFKTND